MTYLLTIRTPRSADHPEGHSSTIHVGSELEAQRIAQEGAMATHKRKHFVTYEVRDQSGRLIVSYTSAIVDA